MTWVVVDVEADGPAPGHAAYSMVSFGAVVVEPELNRTFYGKTSPISALWKPEALAVSGFTREEHEKFDDPLVVMCSFARWLDEITTPGKRLTFVSDNPCFDWQFINFYLWHFSDRNPFGHSGRRIGDLYAGWKGSAGKASEWKRLRKTAHTHHPVDDAKGNAEALLEMQRQGLKFPF